MFIFKKKLFYYSFISITFLLLCILGYTLYLNKTIENFEDDIEIEQVNSEIDKKITFVTKYVVGYDDVKVIEDKIETFQELRERYPDWKVVDINDQEIVLEKYIEDLAPELKSGSFFILDSDGYLILYNEEDDKRKIIETFFRIDIKKLESGLPREPIEQLYKGIPVHDLSEYNSVLSTFSEFSTD